jgi:PAS domain S-box-containing protein
MIENISKEVLEAVLNTLPVEVSFVDGNDTVQYFNKNGDRIFPRPRSVIGRKVQNCHPQKSVHVVNQLLSEMKMGKRDVADFWIDVKSRKIYIRYFAVRDENKKYLGCLEVSQDITELKNIEGEKKLLDLVS